ncbi:MAG: hypothetical protein P4L84_29825 [Isosphaeraceae bacterium]|nr:hypothetical protein [Isosphaeraceae bacterium]
MRFSLTALLRLALLVALGSTLVAIEVARLAPSGRHLRVPRKVGVVGLSGLAFDGVDESTRFVDAETGAVTRLLLPAGEHFDDAACSPWQDEKGVSHVIGRWRKDEGRDGSVVMVDFGLACFTYPQGEEVARIACDVLPQGGACWYPGTADRVLFASADGMLYHVSFDTQARAGDRPAGDEGTPTPIRWDVAPPGAGPVMIRHPSWPSAPGFEHTMIVSLRYLRPQPNDDGYTSAQLWWLRLNAKGTAIIAAGRLTLPDETVYDESASSVAATPSGLVVAYVASALHQLDRKLHVAPVRLDPVTGAPRADSRRAVVLADNCADTTPVFGPGGQRVCALLHPKRPGTSLNWFTVPRTWPARNARAVAHGQDGRSGHAG